MKKHIIEILLWTVKAAIAAGFFYIIVPKYDFYTYGEQYMIRNRITGKTIISSTKGGVLNVSLIDHTGKIKRIGTNPSQ